MAKSENEAVKLITLQEVIDMTNKFVSGEITQQEFTDFGNTLTIRAYLPLLDKMAIITQLITSEICNPADLLEVKFAEMLKNIFFYGMLQGYAFIDCTDTSLQTYSNYDLLYPIFSRYILDFCRDDWELFNEYLKQVISSYQTVDLSNILQEVDAGQVFKATQENAKLLQKLDENKELVENLRKISDALNPANKKVVDTLREIALEDVNSKMLVKDINISSNNESDGATNTKSKRGRKPKDEKTPK